MSTWILHMIKNTFRSSSRTPWKYSGIEGKRWLEASKRLIGFGKNILGFTGAVYYLISVGWRSVSVMCMCTYVKKYNYIRNKRWHKPQVWSKSFKVWSAVPPRWGMDTANVDTHFAHTRCSLTRKPGPSNKTTSKTPSTLSESRVPIRTSLLCHAPQTFHHFYPNPNSWSYQVAM